MGHADPSRRKKKRVTKRCPEEPESIDSTTSRARAQPARTPPLNLKAPFIDRTATAIGRLTTLMVWSASKNAKRLQASEKTLNYVRYFDDFPVVPINNLWRDIGGSVQSRSDRKIYVVQTGTSLLERCLLMTTDPGDLVFDPTCGSGTTAYAAEQWGRRWITCDTSRVALTLARTRLMAGRFPYYLLSDTPEGSEKQRQLETIPDA